MSRDLAAAALAAVQAEVVTRTIAVELDFPSGFARYCGAPCDITISGNAFTGLGLLGSVSAVQEGAELRSYGLALSLTGIPADAISFALLEAYQGRSATIWEVLLDANNAPVADPFIVFRGRMDQMDILLGETASVTLRVENRLTDWERARTRRYTAEDQKAAHPSDEFFSFVPAVVETEIVWPAAGYRT